MKKTFDELFNEIVGEAIVNAGQPNTTQPQQNQQQPQQNQQKYQQQQPQQPPATNNQQKLDLDKLAVELAKLQDTDKIKELLSGLVSPTPGTNA